MQHAIEGTVVNVTETFYDEYDEPIYPSASSEPPRAILYDEDNEIIQQTSASPTTKPGEWQIDLSIPYFNLIDTIVLAVVWTLVDDQGDTHRLKSYVTVDPANEHRISDIVVLKRQSESTITFTLPIRLMSADRLTLDLSINNVEAVSNLDLANLPTKIVTATKATFTIPLNINMGNARLEPISLICEHIDNRSGKSTFITRNLWIVTPQMMVAVNMLSNFVDKAKLEQIIPALEYSIGDLVPCLFRGLSMFNQYAPHITAFTGTNMQGSMLECWIICSSWIALSTQMLAEGAHAFDFAGQDVTFNVDRTPSIEAAIGRLDTQIENQVKPYKKLLNKAGITTGDGSIGSQAVSVGSAIGRTTVLNAPTSRLGRGPGPWIGSPMRNGARR